MSESDYSTQHALVILSGGQDSTTCLFWALSRFKRVSALCFSYSQRHARELQSATQVAKLAGVPLEIINLGPIFAGLGPLTNQAQNVDRYASVDALPGGLEATFVPGRNILFDRRCQPRLRAGRQCPCHRRQPRRLRRLSRLPPGVHPGHGDRTERGAWEHRFIATPLIQLNKRETVLLATKFAGAMEALAFTHTCYEGCIPVWALSCLPAAAARLCRGADRRSAHRPRSARAGWIIS